MRPTTLAEFFNEYLCYAINLKKQYGFNHTDKLDDFVKWAHDFAEENNFDINQNNLTGISELQYNQMISENSQFRRLIEDFLYGGGGFSGFAEDLKHNPATTYVKCSIPTKKFEELKKTFPEPPF